jgi:hypothetical protein
MKGLNMITRYEAMKRVRRSHPDAQMALEAAFLLFAALAFVVLVLAWVAP